MKLFLTLIAACILIVNAFAQIPNPRLTMQPFLLSKKQLAHVPYDIPAISAVGTAAFDTLFLSVEKTIAGTDNEELVPDSVVVEYYNKNNGWGKWVIFKTRNEKDGNKITLMVYFLDGDTKTWIGFPAGTRASDQSDRKVLDVVYNYTMGYNSLNYSIKKEYIYTYDEGTTEQMTSYQSVDGTYNFLPKDRTTQVFDANGILLIKEEFYWIPSEERWFRTSDTEYGYDENGNQVLELTKSYHSDSPSVHKKVFEYDANGNLITDIFCYWTHGTSDWSGGKRTDNMYWENGKLKSLTHSEWNVSINNWNPVFRKDYEYDLNGNETKRIESRWNDNLNAIIYNRFYEYGFDEYGNMITILVKEWDTTGEEWIPRMRLENSFNVHYQQLAGRSYAYNTETNEWVGTENKEYEYNDYGNLLHEIMYRWSEDSADWIKDEKKTFGYDSRQNHVGYTFFNWDSASQDWMLSGGQQLYVYEYNELDSIISGESFLHGMKWEWGYDEWGNKNFMKEYRWDDAENTWIMTLLNEYQKDAEGRLMMHVVIRYMDVYKLHAGEKKEWKYSDTGQLMMHQTFRWDYKTEAWEGNNKYEFTYFGDLKKSILNYIWDRELGDWIEFYRETYYYPDEKAVQVPLEILDRVVNVYPNPANRYIRLSGGRNAAGRVELYEINGRKVLSETFVPDLLISVDNLKDGLYLLRITAGKEIFTEKIIIRH